MSATNKLAYFLAIKRIRTESRFRKAKIRLNYYKKLLLLQIAAYLLKAAWKLSPALKREYDAAVIRRANPFFT